MHTPKSQAVKSCSLYGADMAECIAGDHEQSQGHTNDLLEGHWIYHLQGACHLCLHFYR